MAAHKSHCFAAHEQKAVLKPFEYTLKAVGELDVQIDITHCGVCHSDVHQIDDDWKLSKYPIVPGHEIIGTVKSFGSKVTGLRVGDRVGVGPVCFSCNSCSDCKAGDQQHCPKCVPVYNGKDPVTGTTTFGGFSTAIVVDSHWVFPVPEGLPSETAAPLLCAGITMWTPLVRWAKAGQKVGIVGIGGLGHLGVQFAVGLGFDTYALTTTPDKAEAAAKEYKAKGLVTTDAKAMAEHKHTFDLLVCTVSGDQDWNPYLSLLKTGGTLCFVGLPGVATLKANPAELVFRRLNVCGSNTGSQEGNRDMLAFAAKHKIVAKTELFPLSDCNKALDAVKANKLRFRAVLVMPPKQN